MSYRAATLILVLSLLAILFEGFGLAMLLPIFEFIEKNGDFEMLAASGKHWHYLIEASKYISVTITLPALLIFSFSAITIRQVLIFFRVYVHSKALFSSIHQLRSRSFSMSLNASTDLQQSTILGEAVNDVAVELPKAMNVLYGLVHLVSRVLLVLFYLGGLLFLAPLMTVISIGILFLSGLGVVGIMRRTRHVSAAIVSANKNFAAFLMERLRSLRLIRLSHTEVAEIDNLSRLSSRQRDSEIRLRKLTAGLEALIEPVSVFIGFVVLYLGFVHFSMPLGKLGLFMLVMMRLLPVTKSVLGAYQTIVGQWESLLTIDKRLRLIEMEREPKGGNCELESLSRDISYDNVSFSYKGGVPALSQVSCIIPAQRITALVGPSGAGKSTFIDLLPRLRDPDSGKIMLDSVPLGDFSLASLRHSVAFVPQHPQIFNVSAFEHIRYGKPDATNEDVKIAAQLAGAHDFIVSLPAGYDTIVGEEGTRLSGGQRQRLDLARALVRNAAVLILDEPTTGLDADAAYLFDQSIRRIRQETDTTIILIAHTLSHVVNADQILVLENGRLTAAGTHDQLIKQDSWYARAYEQQQNMFENA